MNNENFFFSLIVIWYVSNYGIPKNLIPIIMKIFKQCHKFLYYCNHMIYPDYFEQQDKNSTEDVVLNEGVVIESKLEFKYEDKYLNDIRKLNKEFTFDEEEEELKLNKYLEFFKIMNENNNENIKLFKKKIDKIVQKLSKFETEYDNCNLNDFNSDHETSDDDQDDTYLGCTREQKIKLLNETKNKLTKDFFILQNLIDSEEGKKEIINKAKEEAYQFVFNKRLEKLKNCYVIEYTPLGNVLMIYDITRSTFKYFSDNTIPYRYLEPVARKYVKLYNCRPIFVDMEEELKLAEEKLLNERKEKEIKEKEEELKKIQELKSNNKSIENKKNVFTKFKSYNKDNSVGKSMARPPKNNIPNKQLTPEQTNEKILLKENANRYTYEGKISNFNFLKKIERKVVDKKFAISFADFKKMNQDTK